MSAGTRELGAGDASFAARAGDGSWRQVSGSNGAISTSFAHHAGVYASGERLVAVNRAADEDRAALVAETRVGELFQGLDFARVDGQVGSLAALINEVWRPFLLAMIAALLMEAVLCMPRTVQVTAPAAGARA